MPAQLPVRHSPPPDGPSRVALVTLGCARNDVDSEELAGRLTGQGWTVVPDPAEAEVAVVNTCGFVAAAKKDSIDALLQVADLKQAASLRAVVAVGCLAERYGAELAHALPEADAVLGFDDYADISARLRAVVSGAPPAAHVPRDRRRLLPLAPVGRQDPPVGQRAPYDDRSAPGAPPSGPRPLRRRLQGGPVAPLKLASGCDRRCAFCAIPSFRGSFLSRPPEQVLDEACWLSGQGVRELVLVSENSTSYGKDLGNLRLLEALLPRLAAVDGVSRVRVNYLQPAEMRPSLLDVMTTTPGVVPYFDLSFQHASGPVLRRMRRFGDAERFLGLLAQIRERAPRAGVRSNVIVGFPGETEADLDELERFLQAARLDAVGVFGYSDEDGTEAAGLAGKLAQETVREREERVSRLAEELVSQRAEERIGEPVDVLIETVQPVTGRSRRGFGRAAHQGPDVDGAATVLGNGIRPGQIVSARVTGTDGADLWTEQLVPGR